MSKWEIFQMVAVTIMLAVTLYTTKNKKAQIH